MSSLRKPALRHQVEEARLGLPGAGREKRPQRLARVAVAALEILDFREPQRHELGVVVTGRVRLEAEKTGARVRITPAAEQPLATSQLELVARVSGCDRLHLGQGLQRTFRLCSVLAEWKLVIQVQVRLGRALGIAVGEGGIGETQPDGRHIDGGFVQNVFVDFRRGAEVAQRVSGFGLAERGGLADETWRMFQTGESLPRSVEAAEAKLGHAGIVGRVRAQRRFRRRRRGEAAQRLFVFFLGVQPQRRLQVRRERDARRPPCDRHADGAIHR